MTRNGPQVVLLPKPAAATEKSFWSSLAGNGRNAFGELLVCRVSQDGIVATHATRRRDGLDLNGLKLRGDKSDASFGKRPGAKCGVVLLLPKQQYLTRVLEIPAVASPEAAAMLRLEAEALLPPDLGEVEISWRQLPATREGHQRFEVYVARTEAIAKAMSALAEVGLKADFILPNAIAWSLLAASASGANLLVSLNRETRQLEIATPERDGSLSVRTIESSAADSAHDVLEPGLVESLRSLLRHAGEQETPLIVAWIGTGRPADLKSERVAFEDLGVLFPGSRVASPDEEGDRFLDVAAVSLVECRDRDLLVSANLIPNELVARQERRQAFKRIVLGAGAMVTAMVVVWLSLRCAALRYRELAEELAAQSRPVRVQGKEVGLRRDQLRAVGAVAATRNDLTDVLTGLLDATPAGVSYNQLELTPTGELRLHGQSESLTAVFQLPESLGKQRMFKHIQLLDAGQATRGARAVTEFRIECRFTRQGGQP